MAPYGGKTMSIKEFRELGLVQEINRRFLHPLGLALEVELTEDGEVIKRIWDGREDPEGFIFGPGIIDPTKADAIDDEFAKRAQTRIVGFGFICQPVRHGSTG